MAAEHKRQLETQICSGKDKCGKRNRLIDKTIEKRVREQETRIRFTRAVVKRLAGGSGRPKRGANSNRNGGESLLLLKGALSSDSRPSPLINIKVGYISISFACVLCSVLWKSQSCPGYLDESLEVSSELINHL